MLQTIAQLFDLSGKNAIVTGGGRGIGQAIAFRLAEARASVMIVDIDQKTAEGTANQIKANGGKAHYVHADVANSSDVKKVIQTTLDTIGSVDILVNNAGIFPATPTLQATEETLNHIIEVNLKGVFSFCQAAAQEMVKTGRGGKIINIASDSALRPVGTLSQYEASKAAVISLTKSLALEFGPNNILVNAVAPGSIRTPGIVQQIQINHKIPENKVDGFFKVIAAQLPLRRVGEPDDVARAVLFLASNASDYMTGNVLLVNGGRLVS